MTKKVVMTVLFIVMFVGVVGKVGDLTTKYNREGVVVEVNNNEIVVVDNQDNVWCFYGEGYTVGDNVTMKMFTNNTDGNIYDDVIVKIKVNN